MIFQGIWTSIAKKPYGFVIFHGNPLIFIAVAQWLSAGLKTDGPRVRASLASLHCGPSARHIYPSLVLVQPRKTCPCLTERLLVGRKESNKKTS